MYNSGIGTPYWFEWEIGILECLNMLQDTSIESVILQSTDFQALDDVVVNYSDKSILNIQVKHTDEDANFTYSFLASGKKPLLNELALEWKNNKDNYNFKGIQIVTNKKWGPQETDGKCSMDDFISKVFPCLQDNYNYTSAKPNEQKAIEWYRENLEINLDSNEAACFTKIFSFRKESCLADVEEKIRVKIGEILGTDNSDAIDFCLNSLLSKLNIWATSRREKQEITRENVYGALCYTEPDVPSYELCPEKPILPSRQRFGETFIDDIKKNSNHIIFLEGLPGCGKTNFISYLSQMNESIVDFRFYTYLPVNKVDGSYSDDEGFYLGNILWRSILVQLKKKFEENNLLSVVKFPLIYQFMSVSEMRETVIHFLPEYAKCIGRPCYFFIDGLDHAARSKDARNSFLSQLPRPEEIGDDFYFVLVGQPINDGYPSWMKDNKGITYYSMPALDTDDVVILLEQSGVAENTVDMENLAKTVISVIGNNVLNIIFAILELKKMVLPLSFEAIEKELNSRFLNKQIDKYYEWIISSQEKSLLLYKIEAIMAFSSKRINAYDVAQMCGVGHDEAAFVLNGLYPIIVCEGDRYFAFHNDVRLFLQNAIIHNSNIKGITESIINRIKQDRELWKYRYDISFNLLVSCKATDEVLKLIDVEYVMDSALYGISFDRILELKNTPKDLVYWRMKVLDSLYCNIDLISDDSELIALYRLTNSWIKEYIENDREYNRLETLRSYNYEIISRISSSEIREKLMAKGLYDKAEHKDFSVETGRDYNLEIINLLKEDGYNEKAEGVILTQIDKREIGLHKLIMEAGDIIAQKHMEEYVNRCVVKFILSESKYGYIGSGISDVFERYYEMFNDNTWNLLFENIVTRFAESDYGIIASLWGDFTIFSIYYLSRIDKDKIKALFDCLCKTHESLSSANGRVKIKEEKLILDENITSLSDMVNFQLNI